LTTLHLEVSGPSVSPSGTKFLNTDGIGKEFLTDQTHMKAEETRDSKAFR